MAPDAAGLGSICLGAAGIHHELDSAVADIHFYGRATGADECEVYGRLQRSEKFGQSKQRDPYQRTTANARFWGSASGPISPWNRLAVALGAQRHTTLSENARILALLNVAIADAGIAIWRAKYDYMFWRPITAIQLAGTDGNAATTADATWTPLLTTTPYPDYPSGLCGLAGAAIAVLVDYFGENSSFVVDSDSAAMAGVVRPFTNFTDLIDELVDTRVHSGLHFRFADEDAITLGTNVAQYILTHACLPVHGEKKGQLRK